jgi:hypothetical protein
LSDSFRERPFAVLVIPERSSMPSARTQKRLRWGVPLAAFCAGLLASQIAGVRLSTPAQAATGLSPLERLLIKDEIRDKITLYALYADGDGVGGKPRDLRTLADTLMTPDVVSEIHLADGSPPKFLKGRDVVAASPPENDPSLAKRIAGRHYMVSTVFDDVSPTTVHTRTASVYFDATKNYGGANCGKPGEGACQGVPVKTIMWVYHMTWTKTPQGWQISHNTLRDDN